LKIGHNYGVIEKILAPESCLTCRPPLRYSVTVPRASILEVQGARVSIFF